jgi:hypothetical protein
MQKTSEAILALRPVTFHYRADAVKAPQFGLIAEEVAKVNPALVLPDKKESHTPSATTPSMRCCSMSFSKSTAQCMN